MRDVIRATKISPKETNYDFIVKLEWQLKCIGEKKSETKLANIKSKLSKDILSEYAQKDLEQPFDWKLLKQRFVSFIILMIFFKLSLQWFNKEPFICFQCSRSLGRGKKQRSNMLIFSCCSYI